MVILIKALRKPKVQKEVVYTRIPLQVSISKKLKHALKFKKRIQ